jgi:ABC-type cobalt transport system substrate-binding protein
MKKYTFWIKTAAVFMLLNAFIHSITLFVEFAPEDATGKQLVDLLTNYHPDLGPIFHPSFGNLLTALSSCFSLLCLLGGLLLFYLAKKIPDTGIWKGILNINLIVFGVCFAVMLVFTFLVPVAFSGLIFLSLVAARLTVPKIVAS